MVRQLDIVAAAKAKHGSCHDVFCMEEATSYRGLRVCKAHRYALNAHVVSADGEVVALCNQCHKLVAVRDFAAKRSTCTACLEKVNARKRARGPAQGCRASRRRTARTPEAVINTHDPSVTCLPAPGPGNCAAASSPLFEGAWYLASLQSSPPDQNPQ